MSHPVFISYARTTSRQHAEALHRELGELSFFDTSDIETGEQFPEVLVDALLDAKVVVIFADERYFQRWYCRKELETALKPFEILSKQSSHTQEKQNSTLDGIILALPPNQPGKVMTRLLHNLPPRLGTANWPMADNTTALATLIRNQVKTIQHSFGEVLDTLEKRVYVRNELLEESALPPPSDLRSVPHSELQGMPVSLRKGFVGRANELWTIHTALSGMDGEPEPAVALFAHGGFGKTRLAAEYVQRYGAAHFPGGLFWINAERGKEGLEEQFYAILQSIRPIIPSLKDLRDTGGQDAVANEMVTAVTEASQQGRVLMVVDNVPEIPPAPLLDLVPRDGSSRSLGHVTAEPGALSRRHQRSNRSPADALRLDRTPHPPDRPTVLAGRRLATDRGGMGGAVSFGIGTLEYHTASGWPDTCAIAQESSRLETDGRT
jgi:hypothetical protein